MYRFRPNLAVVMLWLCGAVGFQGTAAASIIFEQLPGANSNSSSISSNLDNFGGTPGFRVADDFTLAQGGTVTDVHWWGKPNSGGNDFTFTFYADNGGAPGSVLLSTSGSLTTSVVSVGSGFDPVDFYSSDLTQPFITSAGVRYWVSIFNNAPDASWSWLAADSPGDGSRQQQNGTTSWAAIPTDMAFQLTRASAPEPATLALLGIGLAGLGFSRRTRKQ